MTHNKKVIEFPSGEPTKWTFWDFEGAIEDWYQNELSEEAQMAFDALLKNIVRVQNHLQWPGFRKFLKGVAEPIWELELTADKRQYRLLGIFASGVAPECWPRPMATVRKQAILLVGCYHKSKVYTPANAIKRAENRVRALKEGRAKLYERPIIEDL